MDEQTQDRLTRAATEIARLNGIVERQEKKLKLLEELQHVSTTRTPTRELWFQAYRTLVGRGESLEQAAEFADSMIEAFKERSSG